MSKKLSAKGYQRVIQSLFEVYSGRVRKLAKQTQDNTLNPFLSKRGWHLLVDMANYHLIDNTGKEIVCQEVIASTQGRSEVKHVCEILEIRVPGINRPLGSLMQEVNDV